MVEKRVTTLRSNSWYSSVNILNMLYIIEKRVKGSITSGYFRQKLTLISELQFIVASPFQKLTLFKSKGKVNKKQATSTRASHNRARTGLNKLYSYMLYTYSERRHSGLPEYALFQKLNFLKKNRLSEAGFPLQVDYQSIIDHNEFLQM